MPEEPESETAARTEMPRLGGSARVGVGILLSRLAGLGRESVLASVFGAGGLADVLAIAFRGPNLLQNLLGEQTLSASFIPIYSRLLEQGREEDAGRFAGAVFGLLLAVTAVVTAAGVFLARPFVALIAPGFLADAASGAALDRFELTVMAVRIIFPMTGFLVLSAWALGVLNSHRRFFLPYFAPVLWNAAIVGALGGALLWLGGDDPADRGRRLLLAACLGALVGGALQFVVQLPTVARVLKGFRFSISTRVEGVRDALKAFGPVVTGRGAVQLSAWVDGVLVSLLAAGAAGALRWAQILYLLPIGLFAMAVAAAELPELSRRSITADSHEVRSRSSRALRQIAFLVLPTTLGYLAFGYWIVGALFRRGNFGLVDNWLVYLVLCGYSLGLFATTWSRLLQNVFYSAGETRRPAAVAAFRVTLSAVLGFLLMRILDRYGVAEVIPAAAGHKSLYLGALGLSLAAGISAWVELVLLRRGLRPLVEGFGLPARACLPMLMLALTCIPVAAAVLWLTRGLPHEVQGISAVLVYALTYLAGARWVGIEEADPWWQLLSRVNRWRS